VKNSTSQKKEWLLTQESFDALLSFLDPDREEAGRKYEATRDKLVRFFEWRGGDDPEGLADETLNRVTRRLAEGEIIRDFTSYCKGVARLLFLEVHKRGEKERQALEHFSATWTESDQAEDPDVSAAQLDCLESCLKELPDEARDLIVAYYSEESGVKIENRKALAERAGLRPNTLRTKVFRIRAQLEACVNRCVRQKVAT